LSAKRASSSAVAVVAFVVAPEIMYSSGTSSGCPCSYSVSGPCEPVSVAGTSCGQLDLSHSIVSIVM
jgi:hypothetical protein